MPLVPWQVSQLPRSLSHHIEIVCGLVGRRNVREQVGDYRNERISNVCISPAQFNALAIG
jgi:hypothetical protein